MAESKRCVHRIYRVNIHRRVNLHRLAHLGRLYSHKPQMLRVRGARSTLLLFSSGRGVLHKCPVLPETLTREEIERAATPATRRSRALVPTLEVELVSATYVCQVHSPHPVDLAALSRVAGTHCSYEPELFPGAVCTPPPAPPDSTKIPAAGTRAWPRLVANQFHTGKVVVMGAVREEQVDHALAYLQALIKKSEEEEEEEARRRAKSGDGEQESETA